MITRIKLIRLHLEDQVVIYIIISLFHILFDEKQEFGVLLSTCELFNITFFSYVNVDSSFFLWLHQNFFSILYTFWKCYQFSKLMKFLMDKYFVACSRRRISLYRSNLLLQRLQIRSWKICIFHLLLRNDAFAYLKLAVNLSNCLLLWCVVSSDDLYNNIYCLFSHVDKNCPFPMILKLIL